MRYVVVNYEGGKWILGLFENHMVKVTRGVVDATDIGPIAMNWILHGTVNP
jgi:hypothetical protein